MINSLKFLEKLIFEGFISSYLVNAETSLEVYEGLENHLLNLRKQQDFYVGRDKQIFTEIVATSTLEREAITNSMQLIKENYFD